MPAATRCTRKTQPRRSKRPCSRWWAAAWSRVYPGTTPIPRTTLRSPNTFARSAAALTEFLYSLLVFLILLGSAAVGPFVRPLLAERHRAIETVDLVRLVVTMLFTF